MTRAIQVESISKRYRLGVIGRTALHEDLARWWAHLRGRPDPTLRIDQLARRAAAQSAGASLSGDDPDHLWALRDVSFEVEPGETLGIIGRNGAGKSTLLKILSRVTAPTLGCVRVKGRIASLLEVGTGFNPELTGRENIFLNGAILGMTRAEVRSRFDEIVEFSGCQSNIDTPVKRYSSGMHVRLAFAVAAHLEPEILVVDEVLAVGDAEFQRKCLGKMSEVASHGRTVLFVSHNLGSIQTLCRNALWLDAGGIAFGKAEAAQVVSAYEQAGCSDTGVVDIPPGEHRVISPFQIVRIETRGRDDRHAPVFKYGETIRIELVCACAETLTGVRAGIALRAHGMVLANLYSEDYRLNGTAGRYRLCCTIPGGALLPGYFEIDVGASREPGRIGLDYVRTATAFSVSDAGVDPDWVHDPRQYGMVRIPGRWQQLEEPAP